MRLSFCVKGNPSWNKPTFLEPKFQRSRPKEAVTCGEVKVHDEQESLLWEQVSLSWVYGVDVCTVRALQGPVTPAIHRSFATWYLRVIVGSGGRLKSDTSVAILNWCSLQEHLMVIEACCRSVHSEALSNNGQKVMYIFSNHNPPPIFYFANRIFLH